MTNCTVVKVRPTRRHIMANMAMAFGTLVSLSAAPSHAEEQMKEAQSSGAEALLTYLHQEVDIPATPQRIYEVLLDDKTFASFTGMPAQISREGGGTFSLFGGLITGRNVELSATQRIVQAWRPASWDPGLYSVVKFEFRKKDVHATVVLDHTGFPEGAFRHLNTGWYEHYWDPMRKFFG